MATDWYYSKHGTNYGPVSSSELKALARAGKLLPTDLVWKEGVSSWKPAAKVKGLFPAVAVAVAVPAPPANPPDLTSAAKGLFGAITATAKRAAAKVAESAKAQGEPVTTKEQITSYNNSQVSPAHADRPPAPSGKWSFKSLSRRTKFIIGFLIVGGILAVILDVTSDKSIKKFDGSTATSAELQEHERKYGPMPKYSSFDGSYEEIKTYLALTLNDPHSVEYDFWSKVVMGKNGWDIGVRYRAKNKFGALILKDQVFTIGNGMVAGVRDH
jgi:hypothetical protein